MKRILIFDLDNTIYPVKSIGDKLFSPLFELMEQYRHEITDEMFQKAKEDIMRKPFQIVAENYHFSKDLSEKGINLLREAAYEEEMKPFSDYSITRQLQADKYLVTTGFSKLQRSKVKQLGIENDFKEIFIIDPAISGKNKKDIFLEIIKKKNYKKEEILVIGDDPDSEISAAKSIGLETFLYDPENIHPDGIADYKSNSFESLNVIIQ